MYNVNEDKLKIELDNDKIALILNAKTNQFEMFIPRQYEDVKPIFTALAWLFSDGETAQKMMQMVLLAFAGDTLGGNSGIKVIEERLIEDTLLEQLFKNVGKK